MRLAYEVMVGLALCALFFLIILLADRALDVLR